MCRSARLSPDLPLNAARARLVDSRWGGAGAAHSYTPPPAAHRGVMATVAPAWPRSPVAPRFRGATLSEPRWLAVASARRSQTRKEPEMRPSRIQWPVPVFALMMLMALGVPAQADHATYESSRNMHALGHSPHPAQFTGVPDIDRETSSDIAFWGNLAIHGNYDGFRIVDISDPEDPRLISHPRCNGNQGDVIVWENIVVRSWNSPASEGRFCDGDPVPVGFEGFHIWDISDVEDPEVVASVETPLGSHTATGVPDLENNRLVVYNDGAPTGFDMIEVPLDDPASSSYLGEFATGRNCHDWAVILGDAMRAACSGSGGVSKFCPGPARRGGAAHPP